MKMVSCLLQHHTYFHSLSLPFSILTHLPFFQLVALALVACAAADPEAKADADGYYGGYGGYGLSRPHRPPPVPHRLGGYAGLHHYGYGKREAEAAPAAEADAYYDTYGGYGRSYGGYGRPVYSHHVVSYPMTTYHNSNLGHNIYKRKAEANAEPKRGNYYDGWWSRPTYPSFWPTRG